MDPEHHSPIYDLLRLLEGLAKGPGPSLAFDDASGVLVSTVETHDAGLETALMTPDDGNNDTIPVERYASREEALEGHQRWLERMRDERPATVTKLGYGWMVEPEEVSVKYDAAWSAEQYPLIKQTRDDFAERKRS